MHLFYTFVVVGLAVVLSPWFLYQALRYRKYIGSLAERMGYLPVSFNLDGDESIWIHAVSVGGHDGAGPHRRAAPRYPKLPSSCRRRR